jgi:NADPH-dependent glutamate synthase beta subunit-like oxidoreductase/NAD-dependent dihydropyrimidine dehydrogenase PreA subunit
VSKVSLVFSQTDCCGCHTCEVACKQEHMLPVGPRIVRVLERSPLFMQYYCHHCDDAPCALSCPEEAIKKDPETGVVLHDPDKCTGCNSVEGKSGREKQQTSPCKYNCPAGNNIQGFIGLTAREKYTEALQLLKETSPFPSICGRVCTFPCESECNRKQIDESVSVRAIERFLADRDRINGDAYIPKLQPARKGKVAIVGSGPAGLAAAYFLAKNGYKTTVFEKLPVAGGMMAVGIPLYRLPRETLAADIGVIEKMGVEIKTGVTFGVDVTFDSLRKEGYNAFFLAPGLHKNIPLDIPNTDLKGVLNGIDFLRDVSLGNPVSLGKKALVVGGGNVAMDVAMTAIRQGAADVSIVYRRTQAEMPAWKREVNEALEEGIKIVTGLAPKQFLGRDGRLYGVEFKRSASMRNEEGIVELEYDESDLTRIDAETVIIAAGQAADVALAENLGIPVDEEGRFVADPISLKTTLEGVFAGGDALYGPRTVVEAIGSGKEASVSIDRYLRSLDLLTGREARDAGLTPITKPVKDGYDPAPRTETTWMPLEERMVSDEVQRGFSELQAVQEAKRCITCGASCVQACPYGIMQFNHEALKAVKCDLCIEKRGRGEAPACTWACPAHCIYWGDASSFPSGINEGLQRIVP